MSALTEWLTAEQDQAAYMLRAPEMAPLLRELPRGSSDGGAEGESASYKMWEGARAEDVRSLSLARLSEQGLVDEFPSGAPDPGKQARWLKFNEKALELAGLMDLVKAAALKVQLVRQVAQGNSLGVWLCVRSLIEHRALAIWLPKQIGASLDALAADVRAGAPLPESSSEVSRPLAMVLAGQAEKSKEEHRAWVIKEQGGLRTAELKLKNVTEAAFSQDPEFRTLYAIASAVLHGRHVRGWDLTVNDAQLRAQANSYGLLVLERLCDKVEEMTHLSATGYQKMRLEHAATVGGAVLAANDRMAKQAFGHIEGGLRFGIDYSGHGTVDSPFCIEAHLQFHTASYALLEQMGVDLSRVFKRRDHDCAGRSCDCWSSSGHEYWVLIRPG